MSLSTLLLALGIEDFRHWFIIPVALCGIVVGCDAVDWFRGRLDTFDPVGILSVIGLHFFFLAPLLHVLWDYWLGEVAPPPDWRSSLGLMACVNFVSLLVYRASAMKADSPAQCPVLARGYWKLDDARLFAALLVALAVSAALQFMIYRRFDGILGYVMAYESRDPTAFRGMGWLFALSESFPVLGAMAFATSAHRRRLRIGWTMLTVMLLVFFCLLILFGGLRGSRSNTVWGLFWATGIIHFWNRPIRRGVVVVGLMFLLLFMYSYGFFKSGGLQGVEALTAADEREIFETRTGRTLDAVLLSDLGRADVQAYLLYCAMAEGSGYELALGRTYVGALTLLIPRAVWPDRPPTKRKEGTEALLGPGSYREHGRVVIASTRVYGLGGEALLNFGPLGVVPAYAALGFAVGYLRRIIAKLRPNDARRLLLPLAINLCLVALIADSDNLLFFVFKSGLFPVTVVFLSTVRAARPSMEGEAILVRT